MIKTDGAQLYVRGLAVPYGRSALIADRSADGAVQLFIERFDSHSWAELPSRVPFTRTHNEEAPLGWAQIRSTPKGLMIEATLIDSTIAADSVSAMRAQLLEGLSIAFAENADRDEWTRGGNGRPPAVLRRGASLRHVALVAHGAYESAKVTELGAESFAHLESEQHMAPYRAERARTERASRAESQKILSDTERICRSVPLDLSGARIELRGPQATEHAGGSPTMPGTIEPGSRATVVSMGHGQLTIAVADLHEAEMLADSYRSSVVQALRAKGSALSRAEMDAIRSEYRVLA
jgi:HK97 family phage prohead protease